MGRSILIVLKQVFNIESYWKVIVYYNVDYNFFSSIAFELYKCGASVGTVEDAYYMLSRNKAKAATFSNTHDHVSIVLFNSHDSIADYLNSIVHEAEHIKQAMLKAYSIEDKGEPPAYTMGYLVSQMWRVFKNFI